MIAEVAIRGFAFCALSLAIVAVRIVHPQPAYAQANASATHSAAHRAFEYDVVVRGAITLCRAQ